MSDMDLLRIEQYIDGEWVNLVEVERQGGFTVQQAITDVGKLLYSSDGKICFTSEDDLTVVVIDTSHGPMRVTAPYYKAYQKKM